MIEYHKTYFYHLKILIEFTRPSLYKKKSFKIFWNVNCIHTSSFSPFFSIFYGIGCTLGAIVFLGTNFRVGGYSSYLRENLETWEVSESWDISFTTVTIRFGACFGTRRMNHRHRTWIAIVIDAEIYQISFTRLRQHGSQSWDMNHDRNAW